MTNNERFNAMLNGCQHPRAIYDALLAMGSNSIKNAAPVFAVPGRQRQNGFETAFSASNDTTETEDFQAWEFIKSAPIAGPISTLGNRVTASRPDTIP